MGLAKARSSSYVPLHKRAQDVNPSDVVSASSHGSEKNFPDTPDVEPNIRYTDSRRLSPSVFPTAPIHHADEMPIYITEIAHGIRSIGIGKPATTWSQFSSFPQTQSVVHAPEIRNGNEFPQYSSILSSTVQASFPSNDADLSHLQLKDFAAAQSFSISKPIKPPKVGPLAPQVLNKLQTHSPRNTVITAHSRSPNATGKPQGLKPETEFSSQSTPRAKAVISSPPNALRSLRMYESPPSEATNALESGSTSWEDSEHNLFEISTPTKLYAFARDGMEPVTSEAVYPPFNHSSPPSIAVDGIEANISYPEILGNCCESTSKRTHVPAEVDGIELQANSAEIVAHSCDDSSPLSTSSSSNLSSLLVARSSNSPVFDACDQQSYATSLQRDTSDCAQDQAINPPSFERIPQRPPGSLGGFQFFAPETNFRKTKRTPADKRRLAKDKGVDSFRMAMVMQNPVDAFDALFHLSVKGALEWINTNLSLSLKVLSDPLMFSIKLMEIWMWKTRHRTSSGHQRCLNWLMKALATAALEMSHEYFSLLSADSVSAVRCRIILLGPSLPATSWASFIRLFDIDIPQEELLDRARQLTRSVGQLNEAFGFITTLSLHPFLSFDDLIVPFVEAKQYKQATELAIAEPKRLHQLVLLMQTIDPKHAYRIVLDSNMHTDKYIDVEIAAKLPELEMLLHGGKVTEFAHMLCGTNEQLKVDLLRLALKLGHLDECYALFGLLEVHPDQLQIDPGAMYLTTCDLCQNRNNANPASADCDFLELPIPVLFEPSDDELEHNLLLSSIVGIDIEHRPNFCQFSKADSENASLLQLSTPTCALILDLLQPLGERRANILQSLFLDADVLKLGFGVQSDFKMLSTTFPGAECFVQFQSVLDMQKVVKNLTSISDKSCNPASLSQSCQHILKKNLDKREQISNWERRPLREGQLMYAALDAYCLTQLLDSIVVNHLLSGNPEHDDFNSIVSMIENIIIPPNT